MLNGHLAVELGQCQSKPDVKREVVGINGCRLVPALPSVWRGTYRAKQEAPLRPTLQTWTAHCAIPEEVQGIWPPQKDAGGTADWSEVLPLLHSKIADSTGRGHGQGKFRSASEA